MTIVCVPADGDGIATGEAGGLLSRIGDAFPRGLVAFALMNAAMTIGCGGAAAKTGSAIGTVTLSPMAVSLPNSSVPGATGSSKRVAVSLSVVNKRGQPITGKFTTPLRIRIYGSSPSVLKAETPVVRSMPAGSTLYFDYNGGPLYNSVIVNAVSGSAFARMSFQPANRGFPGTSSVTFPMTTRNNILKGWGFMASLGGGPAHFVEMDTGSHGVVVPASVLGGKAVGPGAPGQITYTSDGKRFFGHYYLTPITLTAGGSSVTTVPIQVLGVDKSGCAPGYPKCKAGKIGGLGLIGVGFNRGATSSGPPELNNPFLSLTNVIQGSMHPGYIIASKSVTLGLTAANTTGFNTINLTAGGSGPGDWNTAPGCFSFPGISGYPPQCGTLLVDTGINSAIISIPKSQRPPSIASSIPAGQQIQITVPNATSPVLSYGFTVGDTTNPLTPTSIRWASAGTAPFVNTGRDLISSYNYLFDAGSGKLGFGPG